MCVAADFHQFSRLVQNFIATWTPRTLSIWPRQGKATAAGLCQKEGASSVGVGSESMCSLQPQIKRKRKAENLYRHLLFTGLLQNGHTAAWI